MTSVALTDNGQLALYFAERSKGTKTTRYLRALEVATGKLAWETPMPASTGHDVTNLRPAIVGTEVAAVIPDGQLRRIRVYDARTGRDLGKPSPPIKYIEDFGACPDGKGWCFVGWSKDKLPLPGQRYTSASRKFSAAKPGIVRVDFTDSVGIDLSYIVDGTALWTVPTTDLMASCKKWDCHWANTPTMDAIAISLRSITGKGSDLRIDLEVNTFDKASGALRWTADNSFLLDVTDQNGGTQGTDVVYVLAPDPARLRGDSATADRKRLHGMRLRALDPSTGAERWSTDLDDPNEVPDAIRLDNGDLILTEGKRIRLVDAATGKISDGRDVSYWQPSTESRRQRLIQVVEPVRAGKRIAKLTAPLPPSIGVTSHGLRLVAQTEGVVAYRE